MKFWDDEEKRKKWVDDLWVQYKETNDPDYLADMLAVGVFKEDGIPDEIAKEMFEWLEALNMHGVKEKNTFSALIEERNEFIFGCYFTAKEQGKMEDGEARRLVQKALEVSENQFMELDAIRKTIRRHYDDWRNKNASWCEEKLLERTPFNEGDRPLRSSQEIYLAALVLQEFLTTFAEKRVSALPKGTKLHADIKKEAENLSEASKQLFNSMNKDVR